MPGKQNGNKSRSRGTNARKRAVTRRGAGLRDLEGKKEGQARGGESISFNFATIKSTYSGQ